MKDDRRTQEQIRQHYEVEKELAARLLNSGKEERRHLYASLYNELYNRVPSHPQLTQKLSAERKADTVSLQMEFLKRFLKKDAVFLEVGPGDCALSLEATKYVKKVYAVDVSNEITKNLTPPANFQLMLSDGCSIPVPPGSVDIVYSNQLMEHLHPDDALEQLQNIYQALAPDSCYVCTTPNRFSGPHDVSIYFDTEATGFHLKEYSIHELGNLFKKTGFSKVEVYYRIRGLYGRVPLSLMTTLESFLEALPKKLRAKIGRGVPTRLLLGIRMVGTK